MVWRSPLEEVARAAEGLAAQRPRCGGLHVLVGDDPDGVRASALRELLRAQAPELVVALSSQAGNPGFAAGHNRLVADAFAAGADLVVVHNPDLVLLPGAAEAFLGERARGALMGPVLELAEEGRPTGRVDSLGIRWTWDARHLDAAQGKQLPELPLLPIEVAGVSGACLALPRQVYERVLRATGELFDEAFVAYREDAELSLRARRIGIGAVLVPGAHALHDRRLRGVRRGDPHVDALGVRNRFLIRFKHGRWRPGRFGGPTLRDLVVVLAVLTVERSSLPALREALLLRPEMRAKGKALAAASRHRRGRLGYP